MYQAKSAVKNFFLYWDRVPPPPRNVNRHLWKQYLPVILPYAGGKNVSRRQLNYVVRLTELWAQTINRLCYEWYTRKSNFEDKKINEMSPVSNPNENFLKHLILTQLFEMFQLIITFLQKWNGTQFQIIKHIRRLKSSTVITLVTYAFEFFTIGISVRLSDRSKVTQNKINFIKNCPQWGLNSQLPDHQSHALPTVLGRNLLEISEVSFLLFMHHFTCWTLFISRINRAWHYKGLNDSHPQTNTDLAQLVEHGTDDPEVASLNPTGGSFWWNLFCAV